MRLGLIGSGSDAQLRVEVYAALTDATLAGVVADAEPGPDWTTAPTYPDVEALLGEEAVDAIDVRDWTRRQRPIVERCLDAGVDVVCRTPLGEDLDEAAAIRDLVAESDATVLVDAFHRFARENRDARSLLDEGEIGTTTTVHTTRRVPAVDGLDPGPDASEEGSDSYAATIGGSDSDLSANAAAVLRRALSRDVARIRWLFGDVERITTRLRSGSGSSGAYCHAVAVARLSSGAVCHLTVSYGDRHDGVSVVAEYSGTAGRYTYDSETFSSLSARSRGETPTGVGGAFERPRPALDVHREHVARLLEALRGKADPPESLSEATETLRTVRAATESARRGVPVAVAEVQR